MNAEPQPWSEGTPNLRIEFTWKMCICNSLEVVDSKLAIIAPVVEICLNHCTLLNAVSQLKKEKLVKLGYVAQKGG